MSRFITIVISNKINIQRVMVAKLFKPFVGEKAKCGDAFIFVGKNMVYQIFIRAFSYT